jgi:NAD(P)H dehydrogenase (quinone)
MKVLTIYAHHEQRSFCHGVLDHFIQGLRDAGHASKVIDLYAIKFDPVFRDRDVASYIADDIPGDILELMDRGRRSWTPAAGRSSGGWRPGRFAASPQPASPP